MSKLTFNITEIPEEESRQALSLEPGDLDMSPHEFIGGNIDILFYRARHFIRTSYTVQADVELVCDRSLDPFTFPVKTSYEVIFKTDVEEETEDEGGAVRPFDFSSNTFSIEKEVRDSVMLEIPMRKIHPRFLNDEGKPKAFETKSFGDEDIDMEEIEEKPRWKEKLEELKENDK